MAYEWTRNNQSTLSGLVPYSGGARQGILGLLTPQEWPMLKGINPATGLTEFTGPVPVKKPTNGGVA